jgi:hypothetical protein
MIDITGVDLVKFAQKVYELSSPQGLGFMHFTPEPLSDEEAKELVDLNKDSKYPLSMDYVYGRACKMTVFAEEGKLEIHDSWYDHTDKQFKDLLSEFGIKLDLHKKHSPACNCIDCR